MAPPTGSSHMNVALGVLCAAGGVMGYVKARSTPSLVAGTTLAALYGASAYMITATDAEQGHLAGLGTSLALTGAMAARFVKTRALPAGVMTAVGALGTLYNFRKYREWSS